MPAEALEDHIAEKLARGVPEDELIYEVCEQTGKDWPAARAFINQIEKTHKREISNQRFVIYAAISTVTSLAGAVLTATMLLTLYPQISAAAALDPSQGIIQVVLILVGNYRELITLFLGLAMIAGGATGLARTLSTRVAAE